MQPCITVRWPAQGGTNLGKDRHNKEVDEKRAKQCNGSLDAHIAQRALLLFHLVMGNGPAVTGATYLQMCTGSLFCKQECGKLGNVPQQAVVTGLPQDHSRIDAH